MTLPRAPAPHPTVVVPTPGLGRLVRMRQGPAELPTTETCKGPEPALRVAETLAERSRRTCAATAQLPEVVELARVLAERLVGRTLALSDEALTHWAAQILDEARGARRLTLYAAPGDAARLESGLATLDLDERDVAVIADPGRAPGTLRLETELGDLEASVEEALQRLADAARAVWPVQR